MIIQKITSGLVIQNFDTETNKFVDQNFVSDSESDWEDGAGNIIDAPKNDPYLPFDMVQPS